MQDQKYQEKFIILDGHAIIYRAYHALKDLTDPTGQPINAVYGFARILLKVINDYDPKYIAVTFDHKNGKSKRVADFDQYKAQRQPMPDDLNSSGANY
jgi:DNA polymerase I